MQAEVRANAEHKKLALLPAIQPACRRRACVRIAARTQSQFAGYLPSGFHQALFQRNAFGSSCVSKDFDAPGTSHESGMTDAFSVSISKTNFASSFSFIRKS